MFAVLLVEEELRRNTDEEDVAQAELQAENEGESFRDPNLLPGTNFANAQKTILYPQKKPPAAAAAAAAADLYEDDYLLADGSDDVSLDSSAASFAESLFPLDDGHGHVPRHSNLSHSPHPHPTHQSWVSMTSSSTAEGEEIDVGPAVLPEYDDAEEDFLESFEAYFEHLSLDNVRKESYPMLELQRIVHLDYAAAPIFSPAQVEEHCRTMIDEAPISISLTQDAVRMQQRARNAGHRLLRMFNTSEAEYGVILGYSFSSCASLLPATIHLATSDVHPAILKKAAATVPTTSGSLCTSPSELRNSLLRYTRTKRRIFAFAPEAGTTGARYTLGWIEEAQQNGWLVVLDAFHLLPCGELDLSLHQPEFVAGSLHHLVGYPPGLAFLLVKKPISSAISAKLGTVPQTAEEDCLVAFQDAGINSATLAALIFGLEQLQDVLNPEAIQKRVSSLSSWLYSTLRNVSHKSATNKQPLLKIYGPSPIKERSLSIVVFNLLDSTGNSFPPHIVQKLAARNNIMLGTCEPAGQQFSAVRASLGAMSNFQDVYRFVQFLLRFRDEDYMSAEAMEFIEETNTIRDNT